MNITLPPANTPIAQILDSIRRIFIPVVSINEAVPRILLLAPDGTTYALKVDNAGALSTEKIDGKTPP